MRARTHTQTDNARHNETTSTTHTRTTIAFALTHTRPVFIVRVRTSLQCRQGCDAHISRPHKRNDRTATAISSFSHRFRTLRRGRAHWAVQRRRLRNTRLLSQRYCVTLYNTFAVFLSWTIRRSWKRVRRASNVHNCCYLLVSTMLCFRHRTIEIVCFECGLAREVRFDQKPTPKCAFRNDVVVYTLFLYEKVLSRRTHSPRRPTSGCHIRFSVRGEVIITLSSAVLAQRHYYY